MQWRAKPFNYFFRMRLDSPFIRLPYSCDASALAREVRALAATHWRAHPEGHAGNSALPLVALLGNPDNDGVSGPMRATPALAHCPHIRAIFAALGTPIGRSRLMRIEGNAEATLHVDTNYYWQRRVRIHVPIITTPGVRFLCGDDAIHMQAGEFWIFDTWRMHNVINPDPTERIHLVIDTEAAPALRQFFTPSASAAMAAQFINFDAVNANANATANAMTYETRNFPVVMSTDEQRGFIDEIRADLFHVSQTAFAPAGVFFGLIEHFHLQWRALWNLHADRASGYADYEALLKKFVGEIGAFRGQLKLANGSDATFIAMQWLVTPALNPTLASLYSGAAPQAAVTHFAAPTLGNEVSVASAEPATTAAGAAVAVPPRKTRFDRPVFIVAAPRSGSTLLFETLAQSPTFNTVGGEAHGFFERFDGLKPAKTGWHSNRAEASLATAEFTALLESVLLTAARDRDGTLVPASNAPFRFLEKTPKNALRIPMLKAVFPSARFIYLYREPRDNVSSIIDAWRSGGFVTYPDLPGWSPPQPLKWSLALTPGWRELVSASLGEIAAAQWSAVNQAILDDLGSIPPSDWCTVSYRDFIADPQAETARLCAFAEVAWDRVLDQTLPLSKHTLTAPDSQKWRRNVDEIKNGWSRVEATVARARALLRTEFALSPDEPPQRLDATAPAPVATTATAAIIPPTAPTAPARDAPHPFSTTPSPTLGALLQQLRISVAVTTYQSNQLMLIRSRGNQLNTHFVEFPRPMGMIGDGRRLFLGTHTEVIEFRNMADLGPRREDRPDAVYVPRVTHLTGEIDIHELGLGKKELWAINTRFSCLTTIDYDHSFVPRWRPPFITGLSTDDRCHLNGLAMVNGQPKYVTALGECDHARGWRDNKAFGGILMDIDTKQILTRGLSMPHSPRWYRDQLWFLESGYGALCTLNRKTGEKKTIATLPGFTRGLDFYGPLAFIGLSQVRESATFSGIPITEMDIERTSGMYVVNIETGETVAFLKFNQALQEVFAVSVLVGTQWPELLTQRDDMVGTAYALPDAALREIRAAPVK